MEKYLQNLFRKLGNKMKKRVLAIAMGLCLAVTAVGCGEKKVEEKPISNEKITIKKYRGLKVTEPEYADITDEDVEASIKSTLQTLATRNEIKDRAVKDGDIVTIDYSGKIDGVVFEGGTAEGAELKIGSGKFIPGFEEQIIDHKVGETFDINVTFPDDYGSTDLAGKAAVFTIVLHKIEEEIIPELSDSILTQIGTDAKTVEEYKKQVRKDLEASNAEAKATEIEQAVWGALIEQCEVKEFPQEKLDETKASLENDFAYAASYYGISIDEFVQNYYGISLDEMVKNLVTQELAVEFIAEKENIKLTNEEYEKGLKEMAETYGFSDVDEFETEAGAEAVKAMILQRMVGDFLVENCKLVKAKK